MSVTFTKLFSSITESTIWCEPANTRLVWITMLAMADRKGRVFASIPGLANRARVPLEDCEKAITTFLSPDKYSRTPDFEGRRIEPIDGGWRLLNHEKYRKIRDEEATKESKRNYINARRAKERGADVENVERSRTEVDAGRDNAEADTEAEATSTAIAPSALVLTPPSRFDDFWSAYPRKEGKKAAAKAWARAKLDRIADRILDDVRGRTLRDRQWRDRRYIPHPATYLNNERWNDEITEQGIEHEGDRRHRESASERTERKAAELFGFRQGAVIDGRPAIGREARHLALGQDEPDLRPPLDKLL